MLDYLTQKWRKFPPRKRGYRNRIFPILGFFPKILNPMYFCRQAQTVQMFLWPPFQTLRHQTCLAGTGPPLISPERFCRSSTAPCTQSRPTFTSWRLTGARAEAAIIGATSWTGRGLLKKSIGKIKRATSGFGNSNWIIFTLQDNEKFPLWHVFHDGFRRSSSFGSSLPVLGHAGGSHQSDQNGKQK